MVWNLRMRQMKRSKIDRAFKKGLILALCMIIIGLTGCSKENKNVNYAEYELWIGTRVDQSYAMIDQALENGADINAFTYSRFSENGGTDVAYFSPAWGAYKVGNFHIAEYLLKKGADVNYPEDADGTTLAMKIAGNNHFESLFEYGIDFYIQDHNGKRVIDHLVEDDLRMDNNSQYQKVKEMAADSFTSKTLSCVSEVGVLQMKDIYETLSDKEREKVSEYLKQALEGNSEYLVEHKEDWLKACEDDVQAEKAIYAAFAFCNSDIMKIDFEDYGSRQLFLLCAVTAGNWEMADALIAEGVPKTYIEESLFMAIQAGASEKVIGELRARDFAIEYETIFYDIAETNLEWCKRLLEEEDLLSQSWVIDTARTLCIRENVNNGIALIDQCQELSEDDVNDLLLYVNDQNGFEILNYLENRGIDYLSAGGAKTLFLDSVKYGSEEIAVHLYDKGIVLSEQMIQQAMKSAALHGQTRILERLLKTEVKPNNAVVCQAAKSTPEILKLVLEYGGDANAPAYDGWSPPLSYAVYRGAEENVRILIEHGADPYSLDADGVKVVDSIADMMKEQPFMEERLHELNGILKGTDI